MCVCYVLSTKQNKKKHYLAFATLIHWLESWNIMSCEDPCLFTW